MTSLPKLVTLKPLNFCCPAAFFAANSKVPTGVLADRLGLEKRTVANWRSQWLAWLLPCRNAEGCPLKTCPPHLYEKVKARLRTD